MNHEVKQPQKEFVEPPDDFWIEQPCCTHSKGATRVVVHYFDLATNQPMTEVCEARTENKLGGTVEISGLGTVSPKSAAMLARWTLDTINHHCPYCGRARDGVHNG